MRSRSCGTGLRRGAGFRRRWTTASRRCGGWSGGSRAVGHRPVPNRRGRHQRRGQSRGGAHSSAARPRRPAPPIAGARLSRVALRLGHRIDAQGLPSLRRARHRVVLVALPHADDGKNALASPLLAELRGLPPALIVTAEHDPLRDEGELTAEKLRRSGVDVEAVRIAGAAHGFFSGTEEDDLHRLVAAALGRAFGGAPARSTTGLRSRRKPCVSASSRVRADREEQHAPAYAPGTAARSSASTFDRRRRAASARGSSARSTRCWTNRASRSSTSQRTHPDVRVG